MLLNHVLPWLDVSDVSATAVAAGPGAAAAPAAAAADALLLLHLHGAEPADAAVGGAALADVCFALEDAAVSEGHSPSDSSDCDVI